MQGNNPRDFKVICKGKGKGKGNPIKFVGFLSKLVAEFGEFVKQSVTVAVAPSVVCVALGATADTAALTLALVCCCNPVIAKTPL